MLVNLDVSMKECSNNHSIILPEFAALCQIEMCSLLFINLQTAFQQYKTNLSTPFFCKYLSWTH